MTPVSSIPESSVFISLYMAGGRGRYRSRTGGASPVCIWCCTRFVRPKSSSCCAKTCLHFSRCACSSSCCCSDKFGQSARLLTFFGSSCSGSSAAVFTNATSTRNRPSGRDSGHAARVSQHLQHSAVCQASGITLWSNNKSGGYKSSQGLCHLLPLSMSEPLPNCCFQAVLP